MLEFQVLNPKLARTYFVLLGVLINLMLFNLKVFIISFIFFTLSCDNSYVVQVLFPFSLDLVLFGLKNNLEN